jgi:spiro-SPASM protein
MSVSAILFDRSNAGDAETLERFLTITLSKVRKFTEDVYLFTKAGKVPPGVKAVYFEHAREFLNFLSEKFPKTTVLLLNAYSPLLDVESTGKMLEEHQEHVFDYTFPENIPEGLMPELIEGDVAEFIKYTVPEQVGMFRRSVREIFERDISSYDCNIFISDSNLMKYRVNFVPDNLNDLLVTKEIADHHSTEFTLAKLEERIAENPELIRKRPTYYEIELNLARENCEFFIADRLKSPRAGEMDFQALKKLLDNIGAFSENPVVSFGLYGEPFLYSRINELVEELKKHPKTKFLFESRCLFNNTAAIEKALALPNVQVLFDVSFSLPDSFNKYKKPLDPVIPFEGYLSIEKKILSLPERDKIYIQFTRSTVNENELFKFYESWKDFSDRIVIRKPDTFGGLLDAYRVVDLSPVKRFPCLHLKHDLVIFTDGTVPVCREDFDGKYVAGNAFKDGIEKCWGSLSAEYHVQWSNQYDKPPVCKGCDEWWVFNF